MGDKMPKIPSSILDWKERCIDKTNPHYTDIHRIVLKVKDKWAVISKKF